MNTDFPEANEGTEGAHGFYRSKQSQRRGADRQRISASSRRLLRILESGMILALFTGALAAFGADFSVTTPGGAFAFTINGASPNPTLTLVRGQTYTFAVNTDSFHPFQILSTGVSNNNISQGTITYTVPMAASNYVYRCSIHLFGSTITTIAPPSPPPTVRILSLSVGTNVVVKSTGTNNWSVFPEFNTNLASTNWFAMIVQSNRFSNGTNETFCGRPPGNAVFIRVRNQQN